MPDNGVRAASRAVFRAADPLIVMADSFIISNVEKPLAQSVVEPSTTDDDANTPSTRIAASGETLTTCETPAQQPGGDAPATGGTTLSPAPNGGIDASDVGCGLKRIDLEAVCAPGSRPGSVSPTKTDGSKVLDRKSSLKKTFRPVTLNKSFLKDQMHPPGPVASSQSAALSNIKGYSNGPCDAS